MTSEDLKELASVFRAECANVGGPVQGSLQRIAAMMDEKAAKLEPKSDTPLTTTFLQGGVFKTFEPSGFVDTDGKVYEYDTTKRPEPEPKKDTDTAAPSDADDLESEAE